MPNVTQYVLGLDHYVTARDWPHPDARAQRLYLRGDKSLSADAPAADEAPNNIAQLPIEGLCSISTSQWLRSEEHTSELQSLMRISYAVFCLKKKKNISTR